MFTAQTNYRITARRKGTVATKQAQINNPSPPCLTVGMSLQICCDWCSTNVVARNIMNFGLICPKNRSLVVCSDKTLQT